MLDTTPLVGTLGRACYAPCEAQCTRGSLEGALPIRRLKRFIADMHYDNNSTARVSRSRVPNGKRVAIVGSGPAGLTAAWQLARKGYAVKIFEAAPDRRRLPAAGHPRLPPARRGGRATTSPTSPRSAWRSRPTHRSTTSPRSTARTATTPCCWPPERPRPAGSASPATSSTAFSAALDFLRACEARRRQSDLTGKRVVVVGGGNVAMDAARTARRLGAVETSPSSTGAAATEMPAHHAEVEDAEREGVGFRFLAAARCSTRPRAASSLTLQRACRSARPTIPAGGAQSPSPGSDFDVACDVVIAAVGMAHPTRRRSRGLLSTTRGGALAGRPDHAADRSSRTCSPPATSSRARPTSLTPSAQGQRAGPHDRPWLQGKPLDGVRPPAPGRRQGAGSGAADGGTRAGAPTVPERPCSSRRRDDFREVEPPLTEAEADAARRPLPRLRRLLGVRRVRRRLPGRRDRPAHAATRMLRRRGRRGRGFDRVQAVPRRPQAAVRLRQVQERHHRHADGPPARADPALQHDPSPRRRQGARAHRLRDVHGLTRRDGRQPAVLAVLLHVLDQAEPADHGRPADGRRDGPLHGHPGPGQALRRVLRAGQGDGRQLRQGTRGARSPRRRTAT